LGMCLRKELFLRQRGKILGFQYFYESEILPQENATRKT